MTEDGDQLGLFDGGGAAESSAVESVDGLFPLADRIADGLDETDLEETLPSLAAELVAMEAELTDEEERALFLTVLASLVHLQSGSTRMPLDWSEEGPVARRLQPIWGLEGVELPPVETIGETVESILEEDRAGDIVGQPGEYKPLIVQDFAPPSDKPTGAADGETDGPDQGHLYHHRMFYYERRLVEAVDARLGATSAIADEESAGEVREALEAVVEETPLTDGGDPIRYNAEQQYALLTAVHSPLSIVTGGPGTGKTSLVVGLLRLVARLGVAPEEIALAAPTGKAATRLREAVDEHLSALDPLPAPDRRLVEGHLKAQTLHRLLGFSPETEQFYHHEHNPLSARIVIVDEASMIDLLLMDRLMDAVPEDAHLVFLGDADQLPSVKSGAVFRDLVPSQCATDAPWRDLAVDPIEERASEEPTARSAVRLEESFRMSPDRPRGRHILQIARRVNAGETEGLAEAIPERVSFADLGTDDEVGVERLSLRPAARSGDLQAFVENWYRRRLAEHPQFTALLRRHYTLGSDGFEPEAVEALDTLFRQIGSARILTLTRVLARGSENLNGLLHQFHHNRPWVRERRTFLPGEPIIMTQNDYDHMLFNGEQGVVVRVESRANGLTRPMAIFERRGAYRAFPLAQLRHHLEHAYALTVHKAQGSEYDSVAVVLPDEPNPLLSRELLYTAATRARQSVVFVGEAEMIEQGAARAVERHSGLAEGLMM